MSKTPSTLLLIDGYNVIAPVAPPGRGATRRWLEIERRRLLDRIATALDEATRRRALVVFDSRTSPRDQPDSIIHRDILVRFAVEHTEADDLIEQIIGEHPHPKTLTVVSSDHRLQAAARRRKANFHDSDVWLDALLEGKVLMVSKAETRLKTRGTEVAPSSQDEPKLDADEVQHWLQQFGDDLPEQ